MWTDPRAPGPAPSAAPTLPPIRAASTDADAIRVPPAELTLFVDSVCRRMGAGGQVAVEVAEHLVGANLAGHDSHGVLRLPQYVAEAERGDLIPGARPHVLRRRRASVLLDARRGFGHYSARMACELVASLAIEHGVGVVAIRHCGHIGRLGHYCELLANAGLVGMLTVGAAGPGVGVMAPPGGSGRFLAANPWALGVPGTDHPVVVDVSMALLAEGKITAAAARGEALPEGCVVDAGRRPSRDPADYLAGGALLPLGSPVAAHKGFGLALGAALLGGLAAIDDATPTLAGSQRPPDSTGRGEIAGVCLIAIDPEAFGGLEPYRAMIADTAALIADAEAAGAHASVPGAPEHRSRQARATGIPLPRATVADLIAVGARFDVPTRLPRTGDADVDPGTADLAAPRPERPSRRP
ncbi:Ldh family oxidoreductase [Embleya sp. MST-111070]|uniref:Ldh family oxidoreductase n=1 Tax=Embleya sp. MST-111070 TaxID=3398231 RepID=UPI003F73E5BE